MRSKEVRGSSLCFIPYICLTERFVFLALLELVVPLGHYGIFWNFTNTIIDAVPISSCRLKFDPAINYLHLLSQNETGNSRNSDAVPNENSSEQRLQGTGEDRCAVGASRRNQVCEKMTVDADQ